MIQTKQKTIWRKTSRERERISSEDRMIVYGSQVVYVNGLAFMADAYYGAQKPIMPMMDIGLPKHESIVYEPCHLDHIFPWGRQGNNELANYQALAESTNSFGWVDGGQRFPQRNQNGEDGKGSRLLLHSLYVGMMCNEKVNVIDFAIGWKEFLADFDKTGKMSGRYWPFFLRNSEPPYRPVAPGWNGHTLDRRAAFLGDWERRARFARVFCKHTRPEIATQYRILWKQKIGFDL